MIQKDELIKILTVNGVRDFNNESLDSLVEYFNQKGYGVIEARAIISGARKKQQILDKSHDRVKMETIEQVKKYCSVEDVQGYRKIDQVVRNFKKYYSLRKEKSPKMEMFIGEVYELIRKKNGELNSGIQEFTDKDIQQLFLAASIYDTINNYTQPKNGTERVADNILLKIVGSAANNQGNELDMMLMKNITEILDELTTMKENLPAEEVYSGEEIERLLSHTTSIVYETDAKKINAIRTLLNHYVEELKSSQENTEETREMLDNISIKKMSLKAGQILTKSPEILKESFNFMDGLEVRQFVEAKRTRSSDKRGKLMIYFPELRIDGFSLNKRIHMLQKNPGFLTSLNAPQVFDSIESVVNGVYSMTGDPTGVPLEERINKVKQLGFDVNTLLHADNVNELITNGVLGSDQEKKMFRHNMVALTTILKPTDIQKIIQHNIGLLSQDSKWLIGELAGIQEKYASNPAKYKEEMEKFVNSLYTIKKGRKGMSSSKQGGERYSVDDGPMIEDQKEYIELDLPVDTQRFFEPIAKREDPTPEECLNQIYLEMSELKGYLLGQISGEGAKTTTGTISNILGKMNNVSYEQADKGSFVNRISRLQRMFTIVEKSGMKTSGVVRSIEELQGLLDTYTTILENQSFETRAKADSMMLEEHYRVKDGDTIGELKADIEKHSKKFKSAYMQHEASERVLSSSIKLEEEFGKAQEINQTRQDIIKSYETATARDDEIKCLTILAGLFEEERAIILDKGVDDSSAHPKDDALKEMEIEALIKTFNLNIKKYKEVFPTAKAQNHPYAKRWFDKIARIGEKIEALKESEDNK